jgi:hypothetical protein
MAAAQPPTLYGRPQLAVVLLVLIRITRTPGVATLGLAVVVGPKLDWQFSRYVMQTVVPTVSWGDIVSHQLQ